MLSTVSDFSAHTVPSEAKHIVIIAQHYWKSYRDWLDQRGTRFGVLKGGPPHSGSSNLVEVDFLDKSGKKIETEEKDRFLLCSTVSTWILTKGTKGNRRVFSSLKAANLLPPNDYCDSAYV